MDGYIQPLWVLLYTKNCRHGHHLEIAELEAVLRYQTMTATEQFVREHTSPSSLTPMKDPGSANNTTKGEELLRVRRV